MISCKNVRFHLVVIHHAEEKRQNPKRHLLHMMIPFWIEAGIKVTEVFGPDHAPEGDAALLHVDLSVVPSEYLELARKYPVTINGKVTDICKANLSQMRLGPDSPHRGPVIVKTSLNHAGLPEESYRSRPHRIMRRLLASRFPFLFAGKNHYRIYPDSAEVPAATWNSQDFIVEPFRPEKHDGQYCLREWYFFGDQDFQQVELSLDPLFTKGDPAHHLDLPVPQNLRVLREKLGFDYGKFDYTVVDGEAMAFDFNKTIGVIDPLGPVVIKSAETLAKGLEKILATGSV